MTRDAPPPGGGEPVAGKPGDAGGGVQSDTGAVQVFIATTTGPVAIDHLTAEAPELGRSVVCVGGGTETAGIDRAYNAFVDRATGVVANAYGEGCWRLDLSARIDEGLSWQLAALTAHALFDVGRLAMNLMTLVAAADAPKPVEAVVVATGGVRALDLAATPVGFVREKLVKAEPLLLDARAQGRRALVALPAANADDLAPDQRARFEQAGVEILLAADPGPLFARLGLPRIAARGEVAETAPRWSGSPFRGLEPFDRRHRAIFFGRERARAAALDRLRRSAARDCAFLLVHGRSGAGKSSLIRAGLIDDVIEGVVSDAATAGKAAGWSGMAQSLSREFGRSLGWRVAVFTPFEAGVGPLENLARALVRARSPAEDPASEDPASEDPASEDAAAKRLAARLAADPTAALDAARIPDQAPRDAAAAGPRLLVVVDQLEEIFAERSAAGRAERDAFAAALEVLARAGAGAGGAWVAASMRSDYIPSLEECPPLSRLASDERLYRLERPTRAELDAIVSGALDAAGLVAVGADEDGRGLVDALVEAATATRDGLPLAQLALSRLYDLEGASGRLSIKGYEQMGRLEGAIALWAENSVRPVGALEPGSEAARALEEIILALGRRDPETGRVVARTAAARDIARGPRHQELLARLVADRLLVLDRTAGGAAAGAGGEDASAAALLDARTVRVAHEALLNHWPLARDHLETHARDLEHRDRLEREAHDYARSGRDASWLIPEGAALTLAEALVEEERVRLRPEVAEFVAASSAEARRVERRRRTRRSLVIGGLGVTALVLGALVAVLYRAFSDNLVQQSRILALLAEKELRAGFALEASLIALESLSIGDGGAGSGGGSGADADRPHRHAAEEVLLRSWRSVGVRAEFALGPEDRVIAARFSADERRLFIATRRRAMVIDWVDRRVLFDVKPGSGSVAGDQASPGGERSRFVAADFSDDGAKLITVAANGRVALWSVDAGADAPLWRWASAEGGAPSHALFDPQSARVFLIDRAGSVRSFAAMRGAREAPKPPFAPRPVAQSGPVLRVSADGRFAAVRFEGGGVAVWEPASRRYVLLGAPRPEEPAPALEPERAVRAPGRPVEGEAGDTESAGPGEEAADQQAVADGPSAENVGAQDASVEGSSVEGSSVEDPSVEGSSVENAGAADAGPPSDGPKPWRLTLETRDGAPAEVLDVLFAPAADGVVRFAILVLEDGLVVASLDGDQHVGELKQTPDGAAILSVSLDVSGERASLLVVWDNGLLARYALSASGDLDVVAERPSGFFGFSFDSLERRVEAVFDPAGDKVALFSRAIRGAGRWRLDVIDVIGREPWRLSRMALEDAAAPRFSAGGSFLLLISGDARRLEVLGFDQPGVEPLPALANADDAVAGDAPLEGLTISADGDWLAAVQGGRRVVVWPLEAMGDRASARAPQAAALARPGKPRLLRLSDGEAERGGNAASRVVVVTEGGVLQRWRFGEDGAPVWAAAARPEAAWDVVALSAAGDRALARRADGALWVIDVASGAGLARMGQESAQAGAQASGDPTFRAVALSPDGRRVAAVDAACALIFFDADDGRRERVVPASQEVLDGDVCYAAPQLRFSADSRLLAAATVRGRIAVVSVADGARVATAPWRAAGFRQAGEGLVFDPTGARLLIYERERSALLPLGSGRVTALELGGAVLLEAEFSRDGTVILARVAPDRPGRPGALVIDAETGLVRDRLDARGRRLTAAVLAPSGRYAYTADETGTVRRWRLAGRFEETLGRIKAGLSRCLTEDERRSYFLAPERPRWCDEIAPWPSLGARDGANGE